MRKCLPLKQDERRRIDDRMNDSFRKQLEIAQLLTMGKVDAILLNDGL